MDNVRSVKFNDTKDFIRIAEKRDQAAFGVRTCDQTDGIPNLRNFPIVLGGNNAANMIDTELN